MKHINVMPCIGLFLLFAFIASVTNAGASVTDLNVNPSVVVLGETLSISGKATPNEEVSLKSSFVISLPVSEGKYSEEFKGIYFPAGKKTFSVRAKNINDIRVSLLGLIPFIPVKYPLGGPQKATDGIATLSISLPFSGIDVTGEKDVNVYGAALEDASSVILTTDMAIKITADKNGDFKLDINTKGVPFGEFSIAAGGKGTAVQIVRTKPKPTPTPRPSHDRDKEPDITPTPTITPTIAPTPSSSQKSSIGPTSSPSQKQTQTPEPTQGQKQMATQEPTPDQKQTSTPESTPDQKQTSTPKPSPSLPSRLIPGFGAFFAIAGLITVAYLVLALRRK